MWKILKNNPLEGEELLKQMWPEKKIAAKGLEATYAEKHRKNSVSMSAFDIPDEDEDEPESTPKIKASRVVLLKKD